MDREIEKYRFGITLDLQASAYNLGTDTTPPVYVSTICKYALQYFKNEGVTLEHQQKNFYICKDIFDVNIIRAILQAYWDSVNNQCVEI